MHGYRQTDEGVRPEANIACTDLYHFE